MRKLPHIIQKELVKDLKEARMVVMSQNLAAWIVVPQILQGSTIDKKPCHDLAKFCWRFSWKQDLLWSDKKKVKYYACNA